MGVSGWDAAGRSQQRTQWAESALYDTLSGNKVSAPSGGGPWAAEVTELRGGREEFVLKVTDHGHGQLLEAQGVTGATERGG